MNGLYFKNYQASSQGESRSFPCFSNLSNLFRNNIQRSNPKLATISTNSYGNIAKTILESPSNRHAFINNILPVLPYGDLDLKMRIIGQASKQNLIDK